MFLPLILINLCLPPTTRYVPARSSSRVRVLSELKQAEELKEQVHKQKLLAEKYRAAPLKRSVPFESQFRWSDGEIQEAGDRRRKSTPDPNADAENTRTTRNQGNRPQRSQINERAERAKKRGHLEEENHRPSRSRYVDEESEVG